MLSLPPETIYFMLLLIATLEINPVCSFNSLMNSPYSPQIFMLFWSPDTMNLLLLLIAILVIYPLIFPFLISYKYSPFSLSHILIVWSLPAETINLLSLLMATQLTYPVWSFRGGFSMIFFALFKLTLVRFV